MERFQRRLEKAGRAPARRRSSSTSHGTGNRRPGRPRGRDDAWTAQLGGRGAQARRRDRAGRAARSTRSPARHWALRLPIVRGVVALGESLAIGFRALSVSANYAAQEADEGDAEPEEIGRWALVFSFAIAIGFALMLFKVGPALLADLLPISSGGWFVIVEGLIRVTVFVAYLARAQPHPVAPARVPVPRRRAQGDQRLRGRRGADARRSRSATR